MQELQKQKIVDEVVILVKPVRAKRITPWRAFCNSCGPLQAGKNKKLGVAIGTQHANEKHKGMATLQTQRNH